MLIKWEHGWNCTPPTPPPQHTPLKSSQVAIPLLSLFCYAAAVIKVKYVLCLGREPLRTPFRLSLHRSSTRQEQLDLSSAVWNTYSVTFLSGCAEVEIWALWTCLLLENRFLRRPVKLLSLETWLTIRDGASVLVSFRNQLRCVFPHGSQGCICICVCEWMCMCVREIWLLKLLLRLWRSLQPRIESEELHSAQCENRELVTELLAAPDKQRGRRVVMHKHQQISPHTHQVFPKITVGYLSSNIQHKCTFRQAPSPAGLVTEWVQ